MVTLVCSDMYHMSALSIAPSSFPSLNVTFDAMACAAPSSCTLEPHRAPRASLLDEDDVMLRFEENRQARFRIIALFAFLVLGFVFALQRMCAACGQQLYDPATEDPLIARAVVGRVIAGCAPLHADDEADGEDSERACGAASARPAPNCSSFTWCAALLPVSARGHLPCVPHDWTPRQKIVAEVVSTYLVVPIQTMSAALREACLFLSMPYASTGPSRPSLTADLSSSLLENPSYSSSSTSSSRSSCSPHSQSPCEQSLAQLESCLLHARISCSGVRHDESTETDVSSRHLTHLVGIESGLPLEFSTGLTPPCRPRLYTENGAWIPVVLRPFASRRHGWARLGDGLEYDYHHDALVRQ